MQSISIFLSNICNQYQYFSEIHAINIHISLKSMQSLSIIFSNLCKQYQYFSEIYAINIHISLKSMQSISIFLSNLCPSYTHFSHKACSHYLVLWFLLTIMMMITFFFLGWFLYSVFSLRLQNTNMRKSSRMPFHYIPCLPTIPSFLLSCLAFPHSSCPSAHPPKTSQPHNKCPNQL